MIADTKAVNTVLRVKSSRVLRTSSSGGLGTDVGDVPPVYFPPTVLDYEVPGSPVQLDLPGLRSLGAPRDDRRVAGEFGGRPFDKLYALDTGERAFKDAPVRERALSPTLAEKLGRPVVLPGGGQRVEVFDRPLGSL